MLFKIKNCSLLGFFSLCLFAYSVSSAVVARSDLTTTGDDPGTLQSLLGEVHQLRVALQRSNLTAFRTQVILERLKLQAGRVDNVKEALDRTREEIADEKANRSNIVDRLKELDNQLNLEKDETRRTQLTSEQTELKSALSQSDTLEEQRRQKETELSAQLQAEQLKLEEIDKQLNAMQTAIQAEWPQDAPPQNKRP